MTGAKGVTTFNTPKTAARVHNLKKQRIIELS
jgi:hypothetical protein